VATNVLGIASRADKSVAARFSDTLSQTFASKPELDAYLSRPARFEKQFEIPSGDYDLALVFSPGDESFGSLHLPLSIASFDGAAFTISGIALSDHYSGYEGERASLEKGVSDERVPLLSNGLEISPQAQPHFTHGSPGYIYVELYDSSLPAEGASKPLLALEYSIVDRKSGQTKMDTGLFNISSYVRRNDPVIRVSIRLAGEALPPGGYTLKMKGRDIRGLYTPERSADFEVE
jgi:hypothetical protein